MVPGPKLRSQRRTSSALASSVGSAPTPSASHHPIGDHRYWLLVHEPFGRPRTMRPSAASRNSTRVTTPCSAAHLVPSPTTIRRPSSGTSSESSPAVASPRASSAATAASSTPRNHCPVVRGHPGLLDVLDQPLPLADRDHAGAGRLHDGDKIDWDHEHRPEHAQHANQRPFLVEGALDRGELRIPHAGRGRQEDRGRVRGVQPRDVAAIWVTSAARAPGAR